MILLAHPDLENVNKWGIIFDQSHKTAPDKKTGPKIFHREQLTIQRRHP